MNAYECMKRIRSGEQFGLYELNCDARYMTVDGERIRISGLVQLTNNTSDDQMLDLVRTRIAQARKYRETTEDQS